MMLSISQIGEQCERFGVSAKEFWSAAVDGDMMPLPSERVDILLRALAGDADLHDSDTGDGVSADELGIGDDEYDRLCLASAQSSQPEGHVRTSTGRRVYAA